MRYIVIFGVWVFLSAGYAADCADGYNMIDNSGICKTVCQPGYYVKNAGEKCIKITDYVIYSDTEHTVAYGDVTDDIHLKKCPSPSSDIDTIDSVGIPSVLLHSSITHCIVMINNLRFDVDEATYNTYPTHGYGTAPCYWVSGDDGNAVYGKSSLAPTNISRRGCVGGSTLISCDAGFYADPVYTGDALQNHPCRPVDMDYYSPDGDLNRYPCPIGTRTCGYGECADDISDCVPYKTLHVGEKQITLFPFKLSVPTLVIQQSDGIKYYGVMVPGKKSGFLNILYTNNVIYSLINPLDKFETKSGYIVVIE